MKSNHCGFEAPVRGKVLPQGSFEMGENGNLVLTKTGAYSIAKKMLEYIYCCTEYKTAFLFNSIRNKVKRTCVISKSHATVIDEEEYMKLNEEPVRIFFIDKEDKFTEMDDISFCYPQDVHIADRNSRECGAERSRSGISGLFFNQYISLIIR